MRSQPVRPLHAVVVMAALLAGLWVLEGLDQLSGNALDAYGIHAREVDGLPEIFTAPPFTISNHASGSVMVWPPHCGSTAGVLLLSSSVTRKLNSILWPPSMRCSFHGPGFPFGFSFHQIRLPCEAELTTSR